jgi:hypothetical protein
MNSEAKILRKGCFSFRKNTAKGNASLVECCPAGFVPGKRKSPCLGAYDSMLETCMREYVRKSAGDCDRSKIRTKELPLIIEKDFRDEMTRWRPCRRDGRPGYGFGPLKGSRSNHVSRSGAAMAERRAAPMVQPASRDRSPFLRSNAMPDGSRHEPAADAGAP